MSTMNVTLEDSIAATAWASAGLGAFDSEKAAEMDSNNDGIVSADEIAEYMGAPVDELSEDKTAYSVVDIEKSPETFDEVASTLMACMASFSEIKDYVGKIVEKCKSLASKIKDTNSEIEAISVTPNAYSCLGANSDDDTQKGKNTNVSLLAKSNTSKYSTVARKIEQKTKLSQTYAVEINENSIQLNDAKDAIQTTENSVGVAIAAVEEASTETSATADSSVSQTNTSSTEAKTQTADNSSSGNKISLDIYQMMEFNALCQSTNSAYTAASNSVDKGVAENSNTMSVKVSMDDALNQKEEQLKKAIEDDENKEADYNGISNSNHNTSANTIDSTLSMDDSTVKKAKK